MNRLVSLASAAALCLLAGCSERPLSVAEAAPEPVVEQPVVVPALAFEADFTGQPDGPPAGLELYDNTPDTRWPAAVTPGLAVVDGALQSTAVGPGLAAAYAQVDVGRPVTRIGAEVTFTGDGDPVGALCLPIWTEPFDQTRPRVPNAPVHLLVTRVGWIYQVYELNDEVTLAQGAFDPVLPADVPLTVDVRLSGDLVTVQLPDGSSAQVADPRIAEPARYATFESYQMDAGTMNRPRILRAWAD